MLQKEIGGQTLAAQGPAQDLVTDVIGGKGLLVHIDF
jgi:hypothetical protein